MHVDKYRYPNSNVLINKLGITSKKDLLNAEVRLTYIRLKELEIKPLKGKYDFKHLKAIHKYIFQDLYDWAGKERTVDIGKGNLFCPACNIPSYAETVFSKYYVQCYEARTDYNKFINVLAENYGDLNALHPFREGNGRTQREFARLICLACGYRFKLTHTTHQDMLKASILSFNQVDNSLFEKILSNGVTLLTEDQPTLGTLDILTSDDLDIKNTITDDYGYEEYNASDEQINFYKTKIKNMKKTVKKHSFTR